jgi:hypothetical protein
MRIGIMLPAHAGHAIKISLWPDFLDTWPPVGWRRSRPVEATAPRMWPVLFAGEAWLQRAGDPNLPLRVADVGQHCAGLAGEGSRPGCTWLSRHACSLPAPLAHVWDRGEKRGQGPSV